MGCWLLGIQAPDYPWDDFLLDFFPVMIHLLDKFTFGDLFPSERESRSWKLPGISFLAYFPHKPTASCWILECWRMVWFLSFREPKSRIWIILSGAVFPWRTSWWHQMGSNPSFGIFEHSKGFSWPMKATKK